MKKSLKKTPSLSPTQRLVRMRKSFAKDRSVLVSDYDYFIMPHAPIP